MRNRVRESLRVLLTILLSLLVSLETLPMRAIAEDLAPDTIVVSDTLDVVHDRVGQGEAVSDPITGTDDSKENSALGSDSPIPYGPGVETIDASVLSGDGETIETALVDEQLTQQLPGIVEPQSVAGILTEGFVDASGSRYTITVTYDESAGIPEGAQLVAAPYDGRYESYGLNVDAYARQALTLGSMDSVLAMKNVDVSIMAEGKRVQPKNDVTVTIETDAFDPVRALYVEAAVVDEAAEDVGGPICAKLSANARPSHLEGQSALSSTAQTGQENNMTITIATSRLGTISVALVATRVDIWSGRGLDAWLWVPRTDNPVRLRQIDAPALEDGLVALACYEVEREAGDSGDTTLLLEAVRNDMTMDAADAAAAAEGHGVCCYLADSSGPVSNDALFGPDGTEGAIPFDATNRCLLLAWDLGLRNASVNMGSITVEGMMPEGTNGVAVDVSDRYEDPTPIILDANEGLSAQSDPSASEFTTVAAFDISLSTDGVEYQPAGDRPLSVTIRDTALKKDADVVVIHVADDGRTERVSEFTLTDGSISFQATGFSTYLVAREEDVQEGRSATFTLHAHAKTYGRLSTVRFVDTEKNPLMSTVTNTHYVSYTGSGTESNDTNTIDMYKFSDKLDPGIADEYEFSRVFVQQTDTTEKDFRFVQVGDGTAVGQDASILRAYLYQTSIAESAAGKDYDGTWYALTNGGNMDDLYIEFYHVAPASFRAIDTRKDPVQGAGFALFYDEDCLWPLEYKSEEVTAVSDEDGNVSFGKIPRGTYYMKETIAPEGYKKTVDVSKIVVDGVTTIADVVHEDDDGSIIISDILKMTLKKVWDDGAERHENDSVFVTVHASGHDIGTYELNKANGWTRTLDGLDPNESYLVSETLVTSNGTHVTNDWISDIGYVERDPHVVYVKANQFRQGEEYVILTTTASGTRALVGNTELTTVPLETDGEQITGAVTDDMVWSVDTLTRDGVIALKNDASGSYLDQNGTWYLNTAYPEPLSIRQLNDDGTVKLYHRPSLDNADSCYLYVYYQKEDGLAEGTIDRYKNNESKGAEFALYQKVNARSIDVTITNRATRIPVAIKSVEYPSVTAFSGVTFDLYTKEAYESASGGAPLMRQLVAGDDGFVREGEQGPLLELSAGTYYLCRTSNLEDEGYAALAPLRFTITRNGALKVAGDDREVSGFAYSTTGTVDGKDCPILQVPVYKEATVELTLEVAGDMADMTRAFGFEMRMPEGVAEISATVAGTPVVLTSENSSFVLGHGQSIVLEGVPAACAYVLTQTDEHVAVRGSTAEGMYVPEVAITSGAASSVTATQDTNDLRVVTLTDIAGTRDNPARVTIANRLEAYNAPATGVGDNASAWAIVVLMSLALIVVIRGRRVVRRW